MIAVAETAPMWYFAWAAATMTLMAALSIALLIGVVSLSSASESSALRDKLDEVQDGQVRRFGHPQEKAVSKHSLAHGPLSGA